MEVEREVLPTEIVATQVPFEVRHPPGKWRETRQSQMATFEEAPGEHYKEPAGLAAIRTQAYGYSGATTMPATMYSRAGSAPPDAGVTPFQRVKDRRSSKVAATRQSGRYSSLADIDDDDQSQVINQIKQNKALAERRGRLGNWSVSSDDSSGDELDGHWSSGSDSSGYTSGELEFMAQQRALAAKVQ